MERKWAKGTSLIQNQRVRLLLGEWVWIRDWSLQFPLRKHSPLRYLGRDRDYPSSRSILSYLYFFRITLLLVPIERCQNTVHHNLLHIRLHSRRPVQMLILNLCPEPKSTYNVHLSIITGTQEQWEKVARSDKLKFGGVDLHCKNSPDLKHLRDVLEKQVQTMDHITNFRT